jgi:small subunit ribosomal protein S2
VAIIDLHKTLEHLAQALAFLEETVASGKNILLVGTKKHVRTMVRDMAERTSMPFVDNRWLGGTFTNFSVIRGRVRYLEDLEKKLDQDGFAGYTKFERLKKREETEKMEEKLGGLRVMEELPGAVLVLDVKHDQLALREAHRAGVPVVALVDTNDNPEGVSHVIPANNDALSSLRLLLGLMTQSIEKGLSNRPREEKTVSQ